jgi:hypothetical protein
MVVSELQQVEQSFSSTLLLYQLVDVLQKPSCETEISLKEECRLNFVCFFLCKSAP